MDDIFNKLPFEDGFTYFRMDDFCICKKNNWDQDKTKTGNLKRLENVFVDEVRIQLRNIPKTLK